MYRINIPKQILILTALSVSLNIVRIIWSDSIYFIYLIWNIFLAYLPFFISSALLQYKKKKQEHVHKSIFIFGGIFWLFLFPNAPYLVTDVIHLNANALVPLWYDALLLFSAAWVGVLLSVYSLSHIEELLQSHYSTRKSSLILSLLILLSSFGIYIGRFLRWNSWDIMVRPRSIWADVWIVFSHPVDHLDAYIFTFFFFVFILTSYYAFKSSKASS